MTKRDWAKIEENINSGLYKIIRLVLVTENQVNPEILVPFNKITGEAGGAIERLKYIRSKVESLKAGIYNIQCRLSPNNAGITDIYELKISPRTLEIKNNIEDHTTKQEEMNNVDFDEYVNLIKENANLKALNTMLETEKNFYFKEYNALRDVGSTKNKSLNDGEDSETNTSTLKVFATTLESCMTGLLPVLQEHYSVKREALDFERQKLLQGKGKATVKKIKIMAKKKEQTIEEIAEQKADELFELSENNEEEFNNQMDELQENDLELYLLVCEHLGIEEEEEEEEQE